MSPTERYDRGLLRVKERFMRERRTARMRQFVERMSPRPGMRVLDLGGTPSLWSHIEVPLRITLLNLYPVHRDPAASRHHQLDAVVGDACDVRQYGDREFDIVFSNSVIEHVGSIERQQAFAREVRRIGRAYWVQTPSCWFPIEPHTNVLFWWFYPEPIRQRFIDRWKPRLPAWTEMIEQTRLLSIERMKSLFPEGKVYLERVYGFPKSYTLYCPSLEAGSSTARRHAEQEPGQSFVRAGDTARAAVSGR